MKPLIVLGKGSWTEIRIGVSKMVSWFWEVLEYRVREVNLEGFHLYSYGEVSPAGVRLLWDNLCFVGKSIDSLGPQAGAGWNRPWVCLGTLEKG